MGLTLESHPATARSDKKLKGQSMVPLCVFAGSHVSRHSPTVWATELVASAKKSTQCAVEHPTQRGAFGELATRD